jgi:hypothetical protein
MEAICACGRGQLAAALKNEPTGFLGASSRRQRGGAGRPEPCTVSPPPVPRVRARATLGTLHCSSVPH